MILFPVYRKKKNTCQGYAHESCWARGQGWALYGYTMMYRETGQEKYLRHAINVAKFIINHPRLPEDKIPYWDFDAPNIPNELRDASAGALMASAFIELSLYTEGDFFEAMSLCCRNTVENPFFAGIFGGAWHKLQFYPKAFCR